MNRGNIARIKHVSVVVDQYLIIVGGLTPNYEGINMNLIVFDMQKETCSQVEVSGRDPGPLWQHSACYWKDNQIIVYGGQYGFAQRLSEVVGIITLSFTKGIIF